jgi:hypothetical protein
VDRSVLIKEATYRAFIDELEKIASSMSDEEWEKLARIFERMGLGMKRKVVPALKRGYESAQVGAGQFMSGHHGHLLGEAAQEGLQHGGMWHSIDPSHALTGGAEGAAAMLAPAAAAAAVKGIRKAAPIVKEKATRVGGYLRSAFGGGGPPSVPPVFAPSFVGP